MEDLKARKSNLNRLNLIKALQRQARNWRGVIVTVPIVSGLVIGVRSLGWLQPLEWTALDTFFQLRPLEPPDKRVLIVGIQESDIQKLKQYPISDQLLATLLNKIKQQKPKAIGLDIYRDIPVNLGYEELIKVFRSTPNLVGVQKVIGDEFNARGEIISSKIAPPPELERLGQISASDTPVDVDGVVRRGMLFPMPENSAALPSLGLALAAIYLKDQGISPIADANGLLKLGATVFTPFKNNDGGYINADAGSYQTLINFRGPSQSFPQVSLSAVLENRIAPGLMRDRIVLIGSVADSVNDFFYTPYSGGLSSINRGLIASPIRTPGVEIHANIVSQILSSVLNNRPLLKVWNETYENFWIVGWALLPAILGWQLQKINDRSLTMKFWLGMFGGVSLAVTILVIGSYQAFLLGWWVPSIAPLIALCGSTFLIIEYSYINKIKQENKLLIAELKEKTEEIGEQLKEALETINTTNNLNTTPIVDSTKIIRR